MKIYTIFMNCDIQDCKKHSFPQINLDFSCNCNKNSNKNFHQNAKNNAKYYLLLIWVSLEEGGKSSLRQTSIYILMEAILEVDYVDMNYL